MTKRMLIDATHDEETRVAVVDGTKLMEFDYESKVRRQLKGTIFLAKVTRVEPSLQAAFVNFGGNRHGFLPFSEIHPDYYRIPIADREALLAEQRAEMEAREAEEREAEEEEERAAARAADGETGESAEAVEEEDDEEEDVIVELGGEKPLSEEDEEAIAAAAERELPVEDSAEDEEEDEHAVSESSEESEEEDDHDEAAGYEESSPESFAEDEDGEGEDDNFGNVQPEETLDADGNVVPSEQGEGQRGRGGRSRGGRDRGDRGGRGGRYRGRGGRGGPRHASASSRRVEVLGGDGIEGDRPVRPTSRRHYKIQEVIKRGQIMLVQASKEERGNKGAAVTTFLSLPGRYCVLMPNSPRGGGVSRKIANFAERKRMREILSELSVPDGMSVIMRTAGMSRTKVEIKRDLDYLLRLWDDIRDLTLQSTAPAMIHEEGNLIRRAVRDLYGSDIDEIVVSGEEGFKSARDFMKVMMPSHAKRVVQYKDEQLPLFQRYKVEGQIRDMSEPTVTLKSGGYLVINPTEALVSIDVNSGRATRERHIEETALKTNMEAAEEVARQLRLRDLGGLVVIDFIDMEDRRNNAKVERKLRDSLSTDRARIQMGRISSFGLMEMSRQRLNPSLTEAQFEKCPHCLGVGVVRTVDTCAILALRGLEEEGMRSRGSELHLALPNAVAIYILNNKRDMLADIERRYDLRVMIRSDDTLNTSAFKIDVVRAVVERDGDDDEESAPQQRSRPTEDRQDDEQSGERNGRRRSRGGRGRNRFRADGEEAESPNAEDAHEDSDAESTVDSTESENGEGNAAARENGRDGERGGRRRGRRGGRGRGGRDRERTSEGDENVSVAESSDNNTAQEDTPQEQAPRAREPRARAPRVEEHDAAPAPASSRRSAEPVFYGRRRTSNTDTPPENLPVAASAASFAAPAAEIVDAPSADDGASAKKKGWWNKLVE